MKRAAIYTRKSVYTGKGESIDNQIKICKEHLERFNVNDILIYKDEGFSGKNVDRPKFQEMMKDAIAKKFDILICYRLDRVSRNIADFATLIQELEKYNISFISVNEQFDTTTPMGRAMMYIASVFSQLERETISERIRDNMLLLAKTGRWLGGRTPTGFKSSPVVVYDDEMNERKMFVLTPIPKELKIVKMLFTLYLDKKSLSQVTKYLLSNNIKTKFNADWSKNKIQTIITNPVYAKSTDEVFKYLQSLGITTLGYPDGVHGMLTYNKRKGKTGPYRSKDEWICAVAKHKGIIEGDDWIRVQKILKENTKKAPRLGKTNTALLTGIMRCGKCGSPMKVAYGSPNKATGKRHFYYVCSLKRNSGCTRCDNKNAKGESVEYKLIEELKDITHDEGVFIQELKRQQKELYDGESINENIILTKKLIDEKDISKENILNSLSLTNDEGTSRMLISKLEALSKEKIELEKKLSKLRELENKNMEEIDNLETIIESIRNFKSLISTANVEEKKLLIGSIVHRIYWYGDEQLMDVKFWGVEI